MEPLQFSKRNMLAIFAVLMLMLTQQAVVYASDTDRAHRDSRATKVTGLTGDPDCSFTTSGVDIQCVSLLIYPSRNFNNSPHTSLDSQEIPLISASPRYNSTLRSVKEVSVVFSLNKMPSHSCPGLNLTVQGGKIWIG